MLKTWPRATGTQWRCWGRRGPRLPRPNRNRSVFAQGSICVRLNNNFRKHTIMGSHLCISVCNVPATNCTWLLVSVSSCRRSHVAVKLVFYLVKVLEAIWKTAVAFEASAVFHIDSLAKMLVNYNERITVKVFSRIRNGVHF